MWYGPSVSAINQFAWVIAILLFITFGMLLSELSDSFLKQEKYHFQGIIEFLSLCAAGAGFFLVKYKLSPFLNIQMNIDWQKKVSARRTFFKWLAFFLWSGLINDLLEYDKKLLKPGEDKFFISGVILLAIAIIFYYTCTAIFCRRPQEQEE